MKSDRNLIFDVIKESERGFLTINKQVKDGLKSWYVSQLESLIKEDIENHELLMQGAAVMESFGFVGKAFLHHQSSLSIKLEILREHNPVTAASDNNLSIVHVMKGNYEKDAEYFSQALTIKIGTVGEDHRETTTSW